MKKFLCLILAVVTVFALAGCESSDYKKAQELYESGDYAAAQEIFADLGDYEDSEKMVDDCHQQIVKEQLKTVYNEIGGDDYYCVLAGDGMSMSIDTNPADIDDSFSAEAYQMLVDANSKLGFPDYVLDSMNQTTSLQGRQSAETDDYAVSWTYHPDNGLQAIYTIK